MEGAYAERWKNKCCFVQRALKAYNGHADSFAVPSGKKVFQAHTANGGTTLQGASASVVRAFDSCLEFGL